MMRITATAHKNARKYHMTVRICAAVGICATIAGFVLFAVGGFLSVRNMGFSPLTAVGMVLFFGGGIAMMTFLAKSTMAGAYVALLDQIEREEQINVELLGGFGSVGEKLNAVKQLFAVGELSEYELVGDRVVAKKSLHLVAEQTVSPAGDSVVVVKPGAPQAVKCPNCGATLSEDAQFCEYCGAHLR